jgi:hypothetical protein
MEHERTSIYFVLCHELGIAGVCYVKPAEPR